ncbi:MAG: hypothetical protein ACOXZM_03925 [Eubacteriales bacterium]
MRKDIIKGMLPDPFVFRDGSRVRDTSDWARRRTEILDDAVVTEFGGMPPKPENLRYEALDLHGRRFTNTYRIHCGTSAYPFTFCFMTWRPDCDGRCPVILTGDALYDTNMDDRVIAEAKRRGFVVAKFNRVELAPDMYNTDRTSGIYPMWPELRFSAISAWAWGYQRVVDVLTQLDYVDPAQIAITGHSRGGKTVLLAGATDERIAYVNPNDSGTHGCGCYRFIQREPAGGMVNAQSETLDYMFEHVPYWMGDGLREYIGREEELPYDTHFIKALIAPRRFLETNAYGDIWGNPRGSYLSWLAAREAWKLYGVPERCQTWYRTGWHKQGFEDFTALFDFIDASRFETPMPAALTRVPYDDMQPLHDWSCPER